MNVDEPGRVRQSEGSTHRLRSPAFHTKDLNRSRPEYDGRMERPLAHRGASALRSDAPDLASRLSSPEDERGGGDDSSDESERDDCERPLAV